MTTKDYKDAIQVQDACNLSGVVISFAEVTKRLNNDPEYTGTAWVRNHPISQLYAAKIADLCGLSYEWPCDAYEKCKYVSEND